MYAAAKASLGLIGVGCAALVVCIMAESWFEVASQTGTVTSTLTQTNVKYSIYGQTITDVFVTVNGNVSVFSTAVDTWRLGCSGACTSGSVISSCNSLQSSGTDQDTFTFNTVCVVPKIVLSFLVVGVALCITCAALIVWTVVMNGPIIYATLAAAAAFFFSVLVIFVYGFGVINKANASVLGVAAATSSSWQASYGYGMAIAGCVVLGITTIVLFATRSKTHDDLLKGVGGAGGGGGIFVSSPRSVIKGGGGSVQTSSVLSPVSPVVLSGAAGLTSPHRQPYVGSSAPVTRPPPLNWQMQAVQTRSAQQQQQWRARV